MPRNTISYHIDSTALTIINLGYFKSVLITTQSGTSCLWWLYCSMKSNIWSDQILFKGLSLEWEYEWCVNWAVLLLTRENRSMCRKEIDSPWSWLVCFCATVMIALMFGISLNFGVLFPVLMDYFQESRERTGNFTEEPVYNLVKFPHSPILHYAFSSWAEKTMTKTIHFRWENRFFLQ